MTTNNETTPIMKKNQKAVVDGFKERKKGAAAPLTTTTTLMTKIGLVVTIVSALMFFFFKTGTTGTTTVEVTNQPVLPWDYGSGTAKALLRSSTGTGDGILVTATADVTKDETKECPYQCQGDDADSGKCCTSTDITMGDSKCFDCFLVPQPPGPTKECRDSPGNSCQEDDSLKCCTSTDITMGDGICSGCFVVNRPPGPPEECRDSCQEDGRKCCTSAGITNSKCSLNGPSDTCQCENTFPKYRNTPCYIEMRCPIDQMWQHHVGRLGGGCKIEPGATCKLGGINQCSTGYHCAFGDLGGVYLGFTCRPKY